MGKYEGLRKYFKEVDQGVERGADGEVEEE